MSREDTAKQKESYAERVREAVARAQAFLASRRTAGSVKFPREIVDLLGGAATVTGTDLRAAGVAARHHSGVMFGSSAARKILQERVIGLAVEGAPTAADESVSASAILDCFALADALGVLRAPEIAPLVGMLTKAQRTDGAWADEQGEASLFLTGMFGGYLARSFQARPSVLAKAGQYLASQWLPARVSGDISLCWGTLVAFAHFYAVNGDELADEVLQRCGRELERGYRKQALQALDLAYVLALCESEAFPAVSLTSSDIAEALLTAQHADGSWPEARCAQGDDEGTVFLALAALKRLTR